MNTTIFRSHLNNTAKTQALLAKIKRLQEIKPSRLVLEIDGDRFGAEETTNFALDPDSLYDTITFTRPTGGLPAKLEIDDLTYTAVEGGSAGEGISIAYTDFSPAVAASRVIQDLTYTAVAAGSAGNSIQIAYTDTVSAGDEDVSVTGTTITVEIESGVTTAQDVYDVLQTSDDAMALVSVAISGTALTAQVAASAVHLQNGANVVGDAGNEVVSVTSDAITVKFEDGVSTAAQIKAAIEASEDASALVTVAITGISDAAQSAPQNAAFLDGGYDEEKYDIFDILLIRRLRTKKYLIRIKSGSNPDAD